MIARLKGIIDYIGKDNFIIDVNGVGYEVFAPNSTIASLQIGKTIGVEIITVVREDAFILYGFTNALEKQWFEILTSVQGVGAKVALAIQSVQTGYSLLSAVVSGDASAFTMVNGVGPKLGNRIVLELKDKVAKMDFAGFVDIAAGSDKSAAGNDNSVAPEMNVILDDAISALTNLGYNRSNAFKAVASVVKNIKDDVTVEKIVPLALNKLS